MRTPLTTPRVVRVVPELDEADAVPTYLQAIDTVVGLLHGFLEPTTIPKWLRRVNAHFGHRTALDVLREGRLSDVVAAVGAEQSGAFA